MDKIDKTHLVCLAAGVGLASAFYYLKGTKGQEKQE